MKKLFIISALVLCFVGFGTITASAQCDLNTASPIKCGFYDEGYQDGIQDAKSNRSNDYKRYRSKYSSTNQYENFYSRGYDAGYQSVRPTVRWTTAQRNAYDAGYSQGQSDRRTAGRGIEGVISGRYDPGIGAFYQQGYDDGFNNRPRQYNVAVGNAPTYPGTGGSVGTAVWTARVDDRTNLIIRGNTMQTQTISGNTTIVSSQTMNSDLPRRATTVSARKLDGRGQVNVIQQPNQGNDFTAIVQVYDARGGTDIYRVEISWAGGSTIDPNIRSNSLRWSGTVEHMAEISISGRDVQSRDTSNLGLDNVDFRLNGQLPRRAVNVTLRRREGRGQITLIQQPSVMNNFTAVVQVYDVEAGGDRYVFDLEW